MGVHMKMKSTILFIALMLVSCFIMAQAQSCPTLMKQWNAGPCRAVGTSGDHIIYGSGAKLICGELDENQAITEISEILMPSSIQDIAIRGDLVASACGFAGVQLVDISDPLSPQYRGRIEMDSQQAYRVLFDGDQAYILTRGGAGYSTLSLYDCSDPDAPFSKMDLQLPSVASDMVIHGLNLYAASLNDGLVIVDISYSIPILIDTVFEALGARALTLNDEILYVAQGGYGVSVFDLSAPDSPQLVEYAEVTGSSDFITSFGNYLYVGTEENGIHILDRSDPIHPVYLSTLDAETPLLDFHNNNSYLFASSLTQGLTLYSLSDPEILEQISTIAMPGEVVNMIQMGSILIVNEYPFGVKLYEISEDYDLALVDVIPVDDRFIMTVQEPYLFVCETSTGSLAIYDLSDPQNSIQLATMNLGSVNAMEANDSHLFFSSNDGVKVVDITEPESPSELLIIPYSCLDLAVYESLLVIAPNDLNTGIKVFDISDLGNPLLVWEWGEYYYYNVEIDDHYVYVSSSGKLNAVDYHQNSSHPGVVSKRVASYHGDLSVVYPLASIVDYNYDAVDKLYIFPILNQGFGIDAIGMAPLNGIASGCFMEDSHVWVAMDDAGLALYDLSNCKQLPDVDFSSLPDSLDIMVRQMVRFSDQSDNYPTSWHWDFGDGTTSEEENPIHFFQEPGVYQVTLSATNIFGTASRTKIIEVIENTEIPPVSLQGTYTYILPSAGIGNGSKASYWSSMVQMYNASAVAGDAPVYLYYMEERGGASMLASAEVFIAAESSLRFDNILEAVFGKQASRGALLISSTVPLTIAASVINTTDEEGILAQRIPVVKPSDLLGCAEAGSVDFLFHDQPVRVNVGIINMSFQPLQIFIPQFVSLYTLEIPPLSYRQLDHMFQYTDGVPPRITVEAYGDNACEGGYFAFVSVIDNRNGNPIYFPIQQP